MLRDRLRGGTLAWLAVLLSGAAALAADTVELKRLAYPDLGKVVRDARGKVVVVDFWQDS